MALELVTLPCLKENFAYLVHDARTGATALVDAPEAAPVLGALESRGWRLGQILITHHHDDHVQAVPELRAATAARVLGAAADAHRLPPLDRALGEGAALAIGDEAVRVVAVPGHTLGHIAFHIPGAGLLFTGDSLMAAGCGRLFEGTAEQMRDSLCRLAALPGPTTVCSGHDYLDTNLAFALSLAPDSPALLARRDEVARRRRAGQPAMPWTLDEERHTNPFLRAADPALKAAIGMAGATDGAAFAALRALRDRF